MPLTNSQYEAISRSYQEKQSKNRHELDRRYEEVYKSIPNYLTLEQQVSALSVSQGKKLLNGDENAMKDLKKMLHDLAKQKESLLVKHGFSKNYLNPIYDCEDCKDTGYVDGKKCHCFQNAIIATVYAQSNIQNFLKNENFSKLSLEYYQGEHLDRFQKAVNATKKFVENFKGDYQNLLFYGTVGTGKSFLSGCAAKELIDNGFSVIYFSSNELFTTLSKYSFDYKSKDELTGVYNDIYTCDLLIIDDLGTEITNQFVASQLFSCLNERHLRQKSTIISTNLSLPQICDTYSERIFSRITANYQLCKITGPDIRMLTKTMTNRK